MTTDDEGIVLLRKLGKQLRYYESNHRAKAQSLARLAAAEKPMNDALQKAETNAALAEEVETYIAKRSKAR